MQGKGRRGGRSTKLATDSASTIERLWVYQGYSKVIRLEREIDEVKSRHNGTLRVGGCCVRQGDRIGCLRSPQRVRCVSTLWGPHKTNVGCCKSNNRHLVIGQTDRYSAAGASAAGAASSALAAAFLPARRVDFLAAFLVSLSMFSL